MTTFYHHLRALKAKGWKAFLEGENDIRLRTPCGTACYCPVTAVIRYLGGGYADPKDAETLGRTRLHLRKRDTYAIINAADSEFRMPVVRSKIASAIGLMLQIESSI